VSRNEPCFCGSGIKQKKCHPEIHEESFAAELYRLYNSIDKCIEEHYAKNQHRPPCYTNNCFSCCYDAFLVSDIEFSVIVYEMRKWNREKIESVIQKAKAYWEDFRTKHPDKSRFFETVSSEADLMLSDLEKVYVLERFDYPCVFLNNDNKCDIYSVRPVVCRLQGTAFIGEDEGKVCEYIGDINKAKEWQADLSHLGDKMAGLFLVDGVFYIRQTPLLYAVYRHFVKFGSGLNILHEDLKFKMPKQHYINFLKNNVWTRNSRPPGIL